MAYLEKPHYHRLIELLDEILAWMHTHNNPDDAGQQRLIDRLETVTGFGRD